MQALTQTTGGGGVGKTRAQWSFGGVKSRFASGSRKRSSAIRARKNKKQSGRDWEEQGLGLRTTEDDATWDDAAAEVDLGEGYDVPGRGVGASEEKAWNTAREAFFSFMGSDASSIGFEEHGEAVDQAQGQNLGLGPPLRTTSPGGWTMKSAMNQAKKI